MPSQNIWIDKIKILNRLLPWVEKFWNYFVLITNLSPYPKKFQNQNQNKIVFAPHFDKIKVLEETHHCIMWIKKEDLEVKLYFVLIWRQWCTHMKLQYVVAITEPIHIMSCTHFSMRFALWEQNEVIIYFFCPTFCL